MKLAIGVCCNRDVKAQFLKSLLFLVSRAHSIADRIGLEALELFLRENVSNLPNGREDVLTSCMERGFDYLLLLDDDMLFPPDMLERLLRHRVACVGVNYVTKTQHAPGPKPTTLGLDGQYRNSATRNGLEEVGRIGLGCVLLRLGALKKIEAPRFGMPWYADRKLYGGEDYFFCDLLREHKVRVHCDHDLSKECGHVGSFVYTFSNCIERQDTGGGGADAPAGGSPSGDVPQVRGGGAGPRPASDAGPQRAGP